MSAPTTRDEKRKRRAQRALEHRCHILRTEAGVALSLGNCPVCGQVGIPLEPSWDGRGTFVWHDDPGQRMHSASDLWKHPICPNSRRPGPP